MSESRVVLSAVLLAAGVAAAVAAGVTRMATENGPHIASVRIAELAAEHAERAAQGGGSADEIRASTRAWAAALERALGEIAERRRMVLLPSRAVAAGAPDLTGLVRSMVEDTIAGNPRAADPRAAGRLKYAPSGREDRP
ncbi:MAG: TrbI F-type domain-containing protein [Rhodospirillales bacterium]|nr:TrbI F-type domain-containing protein [Rhodospirillales bacterium]